MKKFLVLALALGSVSAFAQRHMVVLDGFEMDNAAERSLDFSRSTDDGDPVETERSNLALNYAYALTDAIQLGARYGKFTEETDGKTTEETTVMGLKVIYNISGRLTNTTYVGFHYDMINNGDDESAAGDTETDDTRMTLEVGYRASLGKVWGLDFNWSPSVAYAMTSEEGAGTAKDTDPTTLALNVVKFDVLF